jgi:PKD repeat protein
VVILKINKPHRLILLAFLVLLGMIVSPVFAYTTIENVTFAHTTCGGMMTLSAIKPLNVGGITRVIWVGDLFAYNTSRSSGTISGLSYKNASCYGTDENNRIANVSLNWAFTSGTANDDTYTMDITWLKTGINPASFTGYLCYNNVAETAAPGYPDPTIDCYGANASAYSYLLAPAAGANIGSGTYQFYSGSAVTAPVTSFSCTPTSQYPSVDVVCTDTSTNTPTDWYWSIDAEAMGIKGWQTSTSRNFSWQSAYPGLYSVNLRANNSAGSDWENKTNYVSISANATPNNCNLPVASGYVRTYAQCMDSVSLGVVSGCNIQLKDMEGGSWSNATNLDNGYWCIDSYPAHHINGYADATGYTSTSNLNYPAGAAATMGLLLIPGYVPAAPAGSVYVFAKVSDAYTLYPLEYANIQVTGSGVNSSSQSTNSAGLAIFTVPNNTAMTFTAYKNGWITKSKTITTTPLGPDTAIIELERQTSTIVPTPTAGPGGTVAPTIDPDLNPDGSYPDDYSTIKGQNMLNWLAANGMDLIQLCFLVTVMALLGVKFGK